MSDSVTFRWGSRLVLALAGAGVGMFLWSSAAGANPLEDAAANGLGPLVEDVVSGEVVPLAEELLAPPADDPVVPTGGLAEALGAVGSVVEPTLEALAPALPELPSAPDPSAIITDTGLPFTLNPHQLDQAPIANQSIPVGTGAAVTPTGEIDSGGPALTSDSSGERGRSGTVLGASATPPAPSSPAAPGGDVARAPFSNFPGPSSSPFGGSDLMVGMFAMALLGLALLAMRYLAEQQLGARAPVFAIDTPPG